MTDDTQTLPSPAPEAETTAPGGDVSTQPELELDPEAVGDDQALADDESEDWEKEGKTYKIPKALKQDLMFQRDYTQKTQAVAEKERAVEAQRAEVEETAKFHRENVKEIAKLVTLDEQLAAYERLDWTALFQQDQGQHQYHLGQMQMLERQRGKLLNELQMKQHQALEQQRASSAKLYEDGMARVAKKIPGWSDELAGRLNAYAADNGFSLDELQSFIPRRNAEAYVGTLHKAYLYDQLVAKQRAKAKPDESSAPLTPVPTVGTRRSTSSPLPSDRDDVDTWMRKEAARVAKLKQARS